VDETPDRRDRDLITLDESDRPMNCGSPKELCKIDRELAFVDA